jgi:hypothetical protein
VKGLALHTLGCQPQSQRVWKRTWRFSALRGRAVSQPGDEGSAGGGLLEEVQMTYPVGAKFCCEILELPEKRYRRWLRLHRRTGRYGGGKPGPKQALHALRPEEREKPFEKSASTYRQSGVDISETGQKSKFGMRSIIMLDPQLLTICVSGPPFLSLMQDFFKKNLT